MSPVAVHPDQPAERILDEDAIQPPARGARKLAFVVFLIIAAIPPLLVFVPWRQNVSSQGSVVAFNPADRVQELPAPVDGRIVKIHVREGSIVEKDDLLIEMEDLDALKLARLRRDVELAQDKLDRKIDARDADNRQIEQLRTARTAGIAEGQRKLASLREEVAAMREALKGAEADEVQKRLDARREDNLLREGLTAEVSQQKATAAAQNAKAKVEELKAKIRKGNEDVEGQAKKIDKIQADADAKLESATSKRDKSASEIAGAQKELQAAQSKFAAQSNQEIRAKRDGRILRVRGANSAEYIKKGQVLIELVPNTDDLAVELTVKGNDAPLVTPGSPVRLNFEGWPAVQFVGWPAVARGTFGGRVAVVDSQDDGQGNFRILVRPDPDDEPWPDQPFLRQGGRVKGWVLLQEVSLGYELWRQLNGFPPALKEAPTTGKKKGSAKK